MEPAGIRTSLHRVHFMMKNKLLRCRSCQLKWIPRGETTGECPACGGKDVGGTLEIFHVGILLVVLAVIAWVVPSMGPPPPGEGPLATVMSLFQETKPPPADKQRTHPAAPSVSARSAAPSVSAARPAAPSVSAARPAAPSVFAVIKAKKLTVHVQRGPAKGHNVTLRRGDKVTILDRKDRRYLVRDRRGNQVYVPFTKLTLQKTSETRRQYVQR